MKISGFHGTSARYSRHGMKQPNNFEEITPGRPTAAELRAMALRQQQQIDSQHQLLAAKEQRLRFLKTQEARGAAAAAEGERLRRLRERVEAQESKLRRLRALRGQVDLQKTYNVTLSNDLDSIRALFSEKEKELSLAVAKVEALTRQLEELRRDRRGPLNLIPGNGTNGTTVAGTNQQISPAVRELDKLRRELMYRNQLSLQQDARLHLQREALQQRQAELRSVDQRIHELQSRLQKKKASNQQQIQNQQQMGSGQSSPNDSTSKGSILQHHHQHQQSLPQMSTTSTTVYGQQLNQTTTTATTNNITNTNKLPSNSYPAQRVIPRGNVAAVEPYIHTPQKSSIPTPNHCQIPKTHQYDKHLIHDLANLKLNMINQTNGTTQMNQINHLIHTENDDSKLKRHKLPTKPTSHGQSSLATKGLYQKDTNSIDSVDKSSTNQILDDNKRDPKFQTLPYKFGLSKSASSGAILLSNGQIKSTNSTDKIIDETLNDKTTSVALTSTTTNTTTTELTTNLFNGKNHHHQQQQQQQHTKLTVHTPFSSSINKTVAVPISKNDQLTLTGLQLNDSNDTKPAIKPKGKHHQIPSGNLVVPPRKPISSVAPTTVTSTSTNKTIAGHNPKVHMVAPNINLSSILTPTKPTVGLVDHPVDSPKPALPPKPNKPGSTSSDSDSSISHSAVPPPLPPSSIPTVVSVINKPPPLTTATVTQVPVTSSTVQSSVTTVAANSHTIHDCNDITQSGGAQNVDLLPIKARPLTIKKQPLSEQPRLRTINGGIKPIQYSSRRIEMPPAFLFPEIETAELKGGNGNVNGATNSTHSPNGSNHSHDETDKSTSSTSSHSESHSPTEVSRRVRSISENGKVKLSRRVSFDPLALLLDASLEGELELVKKTAMQVSNPSAANDEGITALHNAICAGHIEIVKFLVEFGCDVNAQDSDGWTPLHCAASCNNLSMVKFLVESGACLFAATLSDHETPAEKCEEDEEGFDGCSEYLYSIQEKLGILNTGEVYAVFSYEAQQQDELSFEVNDRLTILRKGDDAEREWWWAKMSVNSTEKEGYVPRNLLGLYPRVPLQQTAYID